MKNTFPSSAAALRVCRRAGLRLAGIPVGRAERVEKAEGKIKETGTISDRFQGKPLSAHCSGGPRAAPWFCSQGAAAVRDPLVLLDFDRHYSYPYSILAIFIRRHFHECR
jgi:protein tyrosine phosphatase (PTP) superfamily phosphohydrolase (DUF442 family)